MLGDITVSLLDGDYASQFRPELLNEALEELKVRGAVRDFGWVSYELGRMREYQDLARITIGDWSERHSVEVSLYGLDDGMRRILGIKELHEKAVCGDILSPHLDLEDLLLTLIYETKSCIHK